MFGPTSVASIVFLTRRVAGRLHPPFPHQLVGRTTTGTPHPISVHTQSSPACGRAPAALNRVPRPATFLLQSRQPKSIPILGVGTRIGALSGVGASDFLVGMDFLK